MYNFFYNYYKERFADGLFSRDNNTGIISPPTVQERITEDGITRITEDGQIRITE